MDVLTFVLDRASKSKWLVANVNVSFVSALRRLVFCNKTGWKSCAKISLHLHLPSGGVEEEMLASLVQKTTLISANNCSVGRV